MKISRSMGLFSVVLAAGLAMIVGVVAVQGQRVRIGGPEYARIIDGKDLIADVLPPPMFVIEAYLTARMASDDPSSIEAAKAKLRELHEDYDKRIAYWKDADIDPEIRALVLGEAFKSANAFWATVENELLPAIERRDDAAVAAATAKMTAAFKQHRAAIDALVPQVNTANGRVEAVVASEVKHAVVLLGGALSLMAGVILAGAWLIRRQVAQPIGGMTSYMTRLAEGDYEQAVPYEHLKSELGEMARAVAVFREGVLDRRALRQEQDESRARAEAEAQASQRARAAAEAERMRVVSSLAAGLESLSRGDLTCHIDEPFSEEFEALRRDFNATAANLSQTLSGIGVVSEGVQTGSSEIARAADDLSRRTEQQAAALEQTAAALEELTATVKETAQGAQEAHRFVSEARDGAQQSGAVVDEAVSAMALIEESSGKITSIISVIDEIAFQTNLLALNAGVEAARAGEAGRGFAVVASEVRALAQRSADAAKEIKGLIAASSANVDAGVELVAQVGKTLRGITDQVGRIDHLVTAIAASAREQASGLSEVNLAVSQMDHMTQQNAAMVEQTTAAAHAMRREAGELAAGVGRFTYDRSVAEAGFARAA